MNYVSKPVIKPKEPISNDRREIKDYREYKSKKK